MAGILGTPQRVKYVVGFAFFEEEGQQQVVLIKKNKPEWQAGLWNGVGGKIELCDCHTDNHGALDWETPEVAMRREFLEETGCETRVEAWDHFLTLDFPQAELNVLRLFSKVQLIVSTMETEQVAVLPVRALDVLPKIKNLEWIIPLALDKEYSFGHVLGFHADRRVDQMRDTVTHYVDAPGPTFVSICPPSLDGGGSMSSAPTFAAPTEAPSAPEATARFDANGRRVPRYD